MGKKCLPFFKSTWVHFIFLRNTLKIKIIYIYIYSKNLILNDVWVDTCNCNTKKIEQCVSVRVCVINIMLFENRKMRKNKRLWRHI